MTDTRTNMRLAEAATASRARTIERAVEVDLHRDRELRFVARSPDARFNLRGKQGESLLIVDERGEILRLDPAPPL
ncbi:MAG: hypothetical protein M3Q03_16195 [Chloroflexota bacterium]|nr:hypothetical protein [Chloroflexota bacterium]